MRTGWISMEIKRASAIITGYPLCNTKSISLKGDIAVYNHRTHLYCNWDIYCENSRYNTGNNFVIEIKDIYNANDVYDWSKCEVIKMIESRTTQNIISCRLQVESWFWLDLDEREDVIQNIIAFLEGAKERPGMYFYPLNNTSALLNWLSGLYAGCSIYGFHIDYSPGSVYHAIIEEQGWEYRNDRAIMEMQQIGLSNEEIIRKMLDIEIETWKRTYLDTGK
jgi:hypothetical protein